MHTKVAETSRHCPPPDPSRESEAHFEDVLSVAVWKLLHASCQIRIDMDATDELMEQSDEE